MSSRSSLLAFFSGLCLLASSFMVAAEPAKPIKALLIAGGCCHDYAEQHKIISKGIQARANVRVDVLWTPDKSVDPPFDFFKDP
ncbi:MAG: hypothetical protein ACPH9O_05175, partial [Akkermansiaceae bacterium]